MEATTEDQQDEQFKQQFATKRRRQFLVDRCRSCPCLLLISLSARRPQSVRTPLMSPSRPRDHVQRGVIVIRGAGNRRISVMNCDAPRAGSRLGRSLRSELLLEVRRCAPVTGTDSEQGSRGRRQNGFPNGNGTRGASDGAKHPVRDLERDAGWRHTTWKCGNRDGLLSPRGPSEPPGPGRSKAPGTWRDGHRWQQGRDASRATRPSLLPSRKRGRSPLSYKTKARRGLRRRALSPES